MARTFWLCFPIFPFKKKKRRKVPQYVDQYHTFRSKTVKKPVPCDVCRQPIYSQGSCCRVCKYVCHRTCEPRVYSSCDTPLHYPLQGNEVLNHKYPPVGALPLPPPPPPPNPTAVQLRKSQTFPAGRGPSEDHRLQERRDRSRFRPTTIEMDLTFITERIISMSFPMTGLDDNYRNSLQEVTKMLRTKHGENYMILNLSERRNDMSQLNDQLLEYGWLDPLAPPLERLCSICKAIDSWLSSDPQHVVVLHCKGGKERIAIVIAAYMHYSSISASADQALDRFAMKRFYNDKLGGLVTPSHKRYVNYFTGLLSGAIKINSSPLYLHQIVLQGVPNFEAEGGCRLFLKVYQSFKPIFTSGVYTVTNNVRMVTVSLESPIQLRGDIFVKAYHRRTRPEGRDTIFRCQFHTCSVSEYALSFGKEDLDDANDDNRFPEDGRLEFKFSSSPERLYAGVKDLSVPVDYSSDPVVRSNSYENFELSQEENPYDTAYIIGPGLPGHTVGPLDGSPYATVAKKPTQVNGFCNGGLHTASMDSGISSTTPPHSGQSSSSAGGTETVGNGRAGNYTPNGINVMETHAEVHSQNHPTPPSTDEQRKLDELLDGMLAQVETIPDLKPGKVGTVKRVTYSPEIAEMPNGGTNDLGPPVVNGSDGDDGSESDLPYHSRKNCEPFSYLVPGSSPSMARKYRTITTTTTVTSSPRPLPPPPAISQQKDPLLGSRETSPPPLLPPPTNAGGPRHGCIYSHDSAYDSDPNPLSRYYGDEDPNNWLRRQQEKLRERQEAKVRGERYPKERMLFSELRTAQAKLPRARDSSDDDDFELPPPPLADHQRPLYVNTYTNGYGSMPLQSRIQALEGRVLHATAPRSPPPAGKPPIYGRGGSAPSSPLIPSRSSSHDATRHRFGTWQGGNGHPSKLLTRQRSDTSYDRERPFVAVKRAHEAHQGKPRRPSADTFAAISSSPIYQNIVAFQHQPTQVTDVTSAPPPPPPLHRQPRSQLLLTTVPKPGSEPAPRTSSPISGHLDDLELSLQSIGPKRSPPQGDHDVFGTSSNWSTNGISQPDGSGSPLSSTGPGDRPATPGFPVHSRTPYMNQESTPPPQGLPPKSPTFSRKDRSPSPATVQQLRAGLSSTADSRPLTDGQSSPTVYFGQSRRSSLVSLTEPIEVIHHHPMFVKDTSKFWYKPNISREDAINILKDKPPGTFLVRDSNSFPGAFGLALKVSSPPPNVQNKSGDISNELVRHFLIEPTAKGVKLKGCSNEPIFGSLSALVYQHSITPLALPCKLILPEVDPAGDSEGLDDVHLSSQLLAQGAACNVLYLYTKDMESLTGSQAVRKATGTLLDLKPLPEPTVVHFKVSSQGITLTDNNRQLFFRRHYPVNTISHCDLDPDDRRWTRPTEDSGLPITSKRVTFDRRIFGFVARKPGSKTDNQCHLFAELEPEQPASAIVNFVNKVKMAASPERSTII